MRVGKYIKSQDLEDMLLEPQLDQKYLSKNLIFPLNVPKNSTLYCHRFRTHSQQHFVNITCYENKRGYDRERFNPMT